MPKFDFTTNYFLTIIFILFLVIFIYTVWFFCYSFYIMYIWIDKEHKTKTWFASEADRQEEYEYIRKCVVIKIMLNNFYRFCIKLFFLTVFTYFLFYFNIGVFIFYEKYPMLSAFEQNILATICILTFITCFRCVIELALYIRYELIPEWTITEKNFPSRSDYFLYLETTDLRRVIRHAIIEKMSDNLFWFCIKLFCFPIMYSAYIFRKIIYR